MAIFADYTPDVGNMVAALLVQLLLLSVLAAALVRYLSQYRALAATMVVILGSGLVPVIGAFVLQAIDYRLHVEFVIAFFELYLFAILAGPGLLAGALLVGLYTLLDSLWRRVRGAPPASRDGTA